MGNLKRIATTGIVDPTENLPAEEQIQFESGRFHPHSEVNRIRLSDWDHFRGALLSIHVKQGELCWTEGSGVIFAPGIALTAKHVVEPRLASLMEKGAFAFATAVTPHELQMWRIVYIGFVGNTDLALIGIRLASELPPNRRFYMATMTTRVPEIGETLMCGGFRAKVASMEVVDNYVDIGTDLLVGSGKVNQRYLTGRDSMLPNPVLEVNCSAIGGMSGGPVFDRDGFLLGIITSSLATADDLGPTYASLAFPALGHRMPTVWPAKLYPPNIALIDIDARICVIEGRSALKIEPLHNEADGFQVSLNVGAWAEREPGNVRD